MSARILVADDIEANRRLLEAKLRHECFDVDMAIDGADALQKAFQSEPDLILLDVMMPRMDGTEACKRLKSDPRTEHIPVVMVTALGDREDRLRGLQAGADDFLTKPINDFQLLSRIRALTRYKLVVDELRRREASARNLGVCGGIERTNTIGPAHILIIDEDKRQARRIQRYLEEKHTPFTLEDTGGQIPDKIDLVVMSLSETSDTSLRLCSRMRSMDTTRDLPILLIAGPGRETQAVRALNLGASDILIKPLDAEELLARTRTQARRKHYMDTLRKVLDQSVAMAVTDPLTSLHNRRYFSGQLENYVQRTNQGGGPVALLIADLDHFKAINDTHGHDAGDQVLIEFAERLRANIRPGDIACRFGGEEFVVLMPETSLNHGLMAADRIRLALERRPFIVGADNISVPVTMSGGLAAIFPPEDCANKVLRRADEALYQAKSQGRNRILSEFAETLHTLPASPLLGEQSQMR